MFDYENIWRSNVLVEQNGFLICEYCDTKYTMEEINDMLGIPNTINADKKKEEDSVLGMIVTSCLAKNWSKIAEYASRFLEISLENWYNRLVFYFYSEISKPGRIGITAEMGNYILNNIFPLAIQQDYANDKCLFLIEETCYCMLTTASKEINYIRRKYIYSSSLDSKFTYIQNITEQLIRYYNYSHQLVNNAGGISDETFNKDILILKCYVSIYSSIMNSFYDSRPYIEKCQKIASRIRELGDDKYERPRYTTYEQSRKNIMIWGYREIYTNY